MRLVCLSTILLRVEKRWVGNGGRACRKGCPTGSAGWPGRRDDFWRGGCCVQRPARHKVRVDVLEGIERMAAHMVDAALYDEVGKSDGRFFLGVIFRGKRCFGVGMLGLGDGGR